MNKTIIKCFHINFSLIIIILYLSCEKKVVEVYPDKVSTISKLTSINYKCPLHDIPQLNENSGLLNYCSFKNDTFILGLKFNSLIGSSYIDSIRLNKSIHIFLKDTSSGHAGFSCGHYYLSYFKIQGYDSIGIKFDIWQYAHDSYFTLLDTMLYLSSIRKIAVNQLMVRTEPYPAMAYWRLCKP